MNRIEETSEMDSTTYSTIVHGRAPFGHIFLAFEKNLNDIIACSGNDTLEGSRAIENEMGWLRYWRLIERLCPMERNSCSSPHRCHCYSSPLATKRHCLERCARLSRRCHRLAVRSRHSCPRRRKQMPEYRGSIVTGSSPNEHVSMVAEPFLRRRCLEKWKHRVIRLFCRLCTKSRYQWSILAVCWCLLWAEGKISRRSPCRWFHQVGLFFYPADKRETIFDEK